jgi:septal ring factor EnvC (AmiA/AmiB activator)
LFLKSNKKYSGKPFSRLEQVKQRISGLEDKIVIKEKAEELLDKTLKNCERNMQKLSDSIKRPTCESWASKKKKRSKQKRFIIYSTK